jgi:CheY-like chemotaxis protein
MDNPEHLLPSKASQTVILIAEDEVLVRNIVRVVLEGEGYFVLAGSDGEEALALSRRYPGKIDALLSDMSMPRMGGLELRERVLHERPGTQVLLMSGEVESLEGIPFLRKPFVPPVLKERMRQLLASAASV